ncbi:MAG TPA: hypothetical protein VH643_24710 [Gemmataceae bacterium]|jgi:hypothetical protein
MNEGKARTGEGESTGTPAALQRSLARTLLVSGALGAGAGVGGALAACLTLFLWDSLEDGRLAWPAPNELATAAGCVLAGTVLCALFGAVLGAAARR